MRYLILDLETLPIENAAEFVTTDDISAPSNYKDPEKILAYCEAERVKRIDAAALDLDLARICAVGVINDDGATITVTKTELEEREQVMAIAAALDDRDRFTLVTFNGHRYDLPLLMRRARYLGVDFPRINLDRYKSPHIDLFEELSMRGAVKAHGLRWYARRLGWADLLAEDPLKEGGGDVGKAAKEGRWKDIEAHCAVDVEATYRLAVWLGVIDGGDVL